MYPHLEPHGPIMKLDRQELAQIPAATIAADRDYWKKQTAAFIGDWLTEDTPRVKDVADFVEKGLCAKGPGRICGRQGLLSKNHSAQMMFS